MRSETSRRAVLGVLAGLPAAVTLATAVTPALAFPGASDDPILAIYAEKQRVSALVSGSEDLSLDEADALMDIWDECDVQAIATPATTVAGAAVSIEWVRREILEFGFHHERPDTGTRLVLALLDGALGALRNNAMGGPVDAA